MNHILLRESKNLTRTLSNDWTWCAYIFGKRKSKARKSERHEPRYIEVR